MVVRGNAMESSAKWSDSVFLFFDYSFLVRFQRFVSLLYPSPLGKVSDQVQNYPFVKN